MAKLNYYSGFTSGLREKLTKTRFGRLGDPLYNRRNIRTSRVLMKYSTYVKLGKEDLAKYSGGLIVILKPKEYFENPDLSKYDLELGRTCIIYYTNDEDWKKYNPKDQSKGWEDVIELDTDIPDGWKGHYAVNIRNSGEPEISDICLSGKHTVIREGKKQAGLGNYDFDFASEDEMNNVCYQLAYLIWQVPDIKEVMINNFNSNVKDFEDVDINNSEKLGGIKNYIEACISNVEDECKARNLNNNKILKEIRAMDKDGNTVCPLCLEKLTPTLFVTTIEQDEGREVEGNTITEISLFHIKGLKSGEFNHAAFNLGWGHHNCNTIQGNKSIDETIISLKKIIANNSN